MFFFRILPSGFVTFVLGLALVSAKVLAEPIIAPHPDLSRVAIPLTLEKAFEQASRFNASFLASRAGRQAQRQELPIAQARRLPRASLAVNRAKVDQNREDLASRQISTRYDSHTDTLSVRQPIYAPILQAEVSRLEVLAESLEATDFFEEIALLKRVSEAYWQWLLHEHDYSLLQLQSEVIAQRLLAAKRQFEVGQGTRTDIFEVSAEADQVAANLLLADKQRNAGWLDLQWLMGATGGDHRPSWILTQELIPLLLSKTKPLPTQQDATDHIVAAHPEILARKAEIQSLEGKARAVSARHKPTLELVWQASKTQGESAFFTNAKTDSQSLGLQFSWSLYEGGGVRDAERQVAFELEQAHQRLADSQRRLVFEYQRHFLEYQASKKRSEALGQALVSAQQMVFATQKSYVAGFRSVLDVLAAENRALLAANALFQAQVTGLGAWVQARLMLAITPQGLLLIAQELY
jgi:protease secretion system outer membrane protein